MRKFPDLKLDELRETRDALHAFSRVLGGWLKTSRPHRKHWWHASLRPSLRGLTTGIVRADVDFELELDFVSSRLLVRTTAGEVAETLAGKSAATLAAWLDDSLAGSGVDASLAPGGEVRGEQTFQGYRAEQAHTLQQALASVATGLEDLRAGIREESSPIQLWSHHFDLSMIWLPGQKVAGQDPANEEYADKQMNFGFVFGDQGIDEPYFYVTAYPFPDALAGVDLPAGTKWRSEGFTGAVLLYKDLVAVDDPAGYLQGLWSTLLSAGRTYLATDDCGEQAP